MSPRARAAAAVLALVALQTAAPAAAADRYLYAGDQTREIVVFDLQRAGDTPAWTLRGGGALGVAYGLAIDPAGVLYVADADANDLFLFGAGAAGEAAPAVALRGQAAGIDVPSGIALGPDGALFVANLGSGAISVFPPSLGGSGLPLARIDSTGAGLHGPGAVAVDAGGRLAVAGFADDAVAFFHRDAGGAWQPAGILAGPATGLHSPAGVAFDGAGALYVTNANADSVTVYGAAATGDAAPLRELHGARTRLHNPTGLVLGTDGTAYVASFSSAEIGAFAPGSAGDVAPVRTFARGIRGPLGLALAPEAVAATKTVDLSTSPGLATLSEFQSGVLTPDGALTSVDGSISRTRPGSPAGATTVYATIAKGSATQYAGILLGASLHDGYFLDFDGTGACLILKFAGGREARVWPAAVPTLPSDTAPHRFVLRVEKTPAGLRLSGSIDDDPVGPVVDGEVPEHLDTFAVFTGGNAGTLRAFRVEKEPLPRR
jgi:sugar lactone lactonase YvrE